MCYFPSTGRSDTLLSRARDIQVSESYVGLLSHLLGGVCLSQVKAIEAEKAAQRAEKHKVKEATQGRRSSTGKKAGGTESVVGE